MKKKDLQDLRAKGTEELNKKAAEMGLELIKVKAKLLGSKEKNLKKVKFIRRDLAQISTIIREKEILKESNRKFAKTDDDENSTEKLES
ncbi:MAG: 50S ribosomal protein L29 [Candidatus Woesebacteria bacterium GW2011_GWB1_39_12]|uniref:Large ribosomal subunit protein uL29 n=2 Tax=Candidatus Woeseibacteriota TaxID=1752722 RepID=A0A0G0M150_9BACT|nr:MAG: 50S ribosomal protein L29 [Candidatus Woesebacteria bacterium GW2011_GWB1_39_12]KKQ97898.1 MAG: 50S ribosomal protein L29 [Candidatus Woesebacteria bacterium GW2011_GWA1_39_12]